MAGFYRDLKAWCIIIIIIKMTTKAIIIMLTERIVHLFGSQFYFYLSYLNIDLNFYIFIKRRGICPLTSKLGVLTVAFDDLSVTLLELEMFHGSNEKDEIYFPFVSRAKFQKK